MKAIIRQVWNRGGGGQVGVWCTMVPVPFVQCCPTFEKKVGLFVWGYEKPGLMKGVPVHGCGVGIRWSLRPLLTQTILSFHDLGAHYLFKGAITNCKIIYFLIFPEPLENKSCIPDCWKQEVSCLLAAISFLPPSLSHDQSLWDSKSAPLRKSLDFASLSPALSCWWTLSPKPPPPAQLRANHTVHELRKKLKPGFTLWFLFSPAALYPRFLSALSN